MDEINLKNVTGSSITIYGYGVDLASGAIHQFANGDFVAQILLSIEIYQHVTAGDFRIVVDGSVCSAAVSLELWKNRLRKPMQEVASSPGSSDDATKGFSPGDPWLNTSTNTFYKCAKNTATSAVWVSINV